MLLNINEISFFSVFLIFILGILLLDLGVFTKNNHKVGFMEALIWSIVWICFSLAFYFFIIHWGYLIHGIDNLDELIAWACENRYVRELTCGERKLRRSILIILVFQIM